MDEALTLAENIKRPVCGCSKRKRSSESASSADVDPIVGSSIDKRQGIENSTEDRPLPKRKRVESAQLIDSSSSFDQTGDPSKRRKLVDLIDHFPTFQSDRRLTRSLARQLGVGPSGSADEALLKAENQAFLTTGSGGVTLPTSSHTSLQQLDVQSNSTVTTGCHLSTRTHPSSDGARTTTKRAPDADQPLEGQRKAAAAACSSSTSMDQHRTALSQGRKIGGRHSSSQPSTVPKHFTHASASAGLSSSVDLDRDAGSSSSDSMDTGGVATSNSTGSGGRLHTLLDARSLPMHIFGALGPRMQTLFNRCPSHNGGGASTTTSSTGGGVSYGRFESLIQGMQKVDDPSAQLQALIELCNILVMSNEETLGPNFPVKETIRLLIKLLQAEQNFDIMTHACRALTYLMEAAPRVTPAVTDAVPLLLDKLQRVECIDVAEQALAALDLLSKRHSKCILTAGGIGACLHYIDFFSLASQRLALQIVANCCLHMANDDFHFLIDSVPTLTQRLTAQDKKTVELVCVLFTRLVDSYLHDAEKLKRLCDYGLLENVQQMMVASPPVLSSVVFVGVIRMLHSLCRQCSELAVRLLRLNVVAALRYLLVGTMDASAAADAELIARSPHELYELVLLISELLPPLPVDGPLFGVDGWLKNYYYYCYQPHRPMFSNVSGFSSVNCTPTTAEQVVWTWKDDRGLWRPFMNIDNRILETAYQAREEEMALNTMGQHFIIDFVNMVQINEDTGQSQPVQRKVASPAGLQKVVSIKAFDPNSEPRLELSLNEPTLHDELVQCLLPVLYDVYTSMGGPLVRHECLRAMLRMIYRSDGELLLRDTLKKHAISSLLAGMLNSNDLKTVVPALQLCTVLMEKLPDVFHVHFRREGVTHQLRLLATGAVQFPLPSTMLAGDGFSSPASQASSAASGLAFLARSNSAASANTADSLSTSTALSVDHLLSAMGGLPLLHHNHNHHSGRHGHSRHQPLSQSISSLVSSGGAATRTASAASDAGNETASSLSLPPPVAASGNSATSATASTASGAVPKRHQQYQNMAPSSPNTSKSASVAGKGRRATAIPCSKHAVLAGTSSAATSLKSVATRGNRTRTASTEEHRASTSGSSNATQTYSSASGFLQSWPIPKWARSSSSASASTLTTNTNCSRQISAPNSRSGSGPRQKHATSSSDCSQTTTQPLISSPMSWPSADAEKVINWVRQQAKNLMTQYFFDGGFGEKMENNSDVATTAAQQAASVLERLIVMAEALKVGKMETVDELAAIMASPGNVSCFELLQSGLIGALTEFLTTTDAIIGSERLRRFCKAFFGLECKKDEEQVPTVSGTFSFSNDDNEFVHPGRLLVSQLNVCVSQLEQFQVKVQELAAAPGFVGLGGLGGGSNLSIIAGNGGSSTWGLIGHLTGSSSGVGSLHGRNALRFLHSQQIKCNLQRHPDEKHLKQWRWGAIKIEPLARVATIEKYLQEKVFGRRRHTAAEETSGDDESTDEEDDDDDDDSAMHRGELSDGTRRLQILINDKVLPYDMTIYQAVRQYSSRAYNPLMTAEETMASSIVANEWMGPEVWINTHLLFYRLSTDVKSGTSADAGTTTNSNAVSGGGLKPTQSGCSKSSGSKGEKTQNVGVSGEQSANWSQWLESNDITEPTCPLSKYLKNRLPSSCDVAGSDGDGGGSILANDQQQQVSVWPAQTVKDPSLDCLNLLRILFGLTRYWWSLYKDAIITSFQPLLRLNDFHNAKLSAKVSRQLQDPLTVVAGQLPPWVEQLTSVCPFLFPFEVRLAVFHVVALDRDRALQRLLDSAMDNGVGAAAGGGGSDRITPRLERRKVIVNRDDLLKQAESVLATMDGSRAVLEVQYENEAGTGLGPTLEFYALLSRQIQRSDLQLWRHEITDKQADLNRTGGGLYPSACGSNVKFRVLEKIKSKFRLLGKLLGRSLLDGRMLDLPLSTVFYKWLLRDEHSICWSDLAELDPSLYKSILYLRKHYLKCKLLKDEDAAKAIEALELDFTAPGYPNIELLKNGKDKLVTLQDVPQYLELTLHWLLRAGVCRQMEAIRECLNSLIHLKHLRLFLPDEMDQLFCGARSESDFWEPGALLQAVRPDHGYNHDSSPIRWLVDILSSRFTHEQRRDFLQFITGSPRLPVGGLKNLHPPLTIVRKTDASNNNNPDSHLPSVMTCVNYLKLPEYSTLEIMEKRLLTAINHGRYSFHLS